MHLNLQNYISIFFLILKSSAYANLFKSVVLKDMLKAIMSLVQYSFIALFILRYPDVGKPSKLLSFN